MLALITLPAIWLLFLLLGTLAEGRSLTFRRYLAVGVSGFLLFGVAGLKTWSFYVVVSVSIVLAGMMIGRVRNPWLKRLLSWTSIGAMVGMIVVYLAFRPYFPKFFPLLPSLSYLGFRAIAYLVSSHRGCSDDASAGLMQMLFFPVLIMGPITRTENYLSTVRCSREVLQRVVAGFAMLIVAHLLAPLEIDRPHEELYLHWSRFWWSALANSFDFYFTFAGYSHLIISLGLLVGFRLPENFNNPYVATSIRDFWRRWHMSLSFWIRDYIYIPLGGNRKGLTRKCVNLMMAMGLCGLWHGLEWHYLLWGLFHGALMAVESVMDAYHYAPIRQMFPGNYRIVKVIMTFSMVTFSWLLFKYPVGQAVTHLRAMVPW